MTSLVEASKISELREGTIKDILVNGREIILAKAGGNYYASENRCPHMGGKLSKGKLEGTVFTCPLHGSQFDLRNGQVVRWLKGSGLLSKMGKILKSPKQLTTYKVIVEDDKILIET